MTKFNTSKYRTLAVSLVIAVLQNLIEQERKEPSAYNNHGYFLESACEYIGFCQKMIEDLKKTSFDRISWNWVENYLYPDVSYFNVPWYVSIIGKALFDKYLDKDNKK